MNRIARFLQHTLQQLAGTTNQTAGNDAVQINQARDVIFNNASTPDEPKSLREAYLSLMLDTCAQVFLSGIDPKAASQQGRPCLKLNAIYTALLTFGFERELELHDKAQVSEMLARLAEQRDRAASALDLLNAHSRLVLLGDPGSGKSTFVNFVALCLAGEALRHQEINLNLLTSPLPDDDGNDQKERQSWKHGALLPVRVILRDFAASGCLPSAEKLATVAHLWQFLRKQWDDLQLRDYADEVERQLRKQGGLILFDGLDEVPEANSRRVQIKQVVETFAATFPKCRVVVTSRTYAYYNQEWRLSGFREGILAPFSRGQIVRFIDHWYEHSATLRGMSVENARGQAEILKRAIFASSQLRNLAERPLLLTLMASLHYWRGGSLPDKREELYNDVVDLLLDWWESPKMVRDASGQYIVAQKSLTELLKIGKDRVRKALNLLAFQVHERQQERSGTADIAQDALIGTLLRVGQNKDLCPEHLVDYLSDRAGLLVPRGVEVYTFPHRTFQEYLAACYLTDDDFPRKLAKLARDDPNRWREVVLLAGAKAARGAAPVIWLMADALCWRQCDDPELTPQDAWGALLAGQALAETADLQQIEPYNLAQFERVRRWLKAILTEGTAAEPCQGSKPWQGCEPLPARERALAGNLLAIFGDDRPGVRLRADGLPDIAWMPIPAGAFMMGSDESNDEKPRHRVTFRDPFQISRYPVTNAQYEAFIEAGGYTERWRECWTTEGWKWKKDRTDRFHPGGAFDLPNHPVVGVSWYEAMAFCAWLTEQFRAVETHGRASLQCRLPTEAEWEYAARGKPTPNPSQEGKYERYPWGDEITPEHANYSDTNIGATSAVGGFPRGKSAFGCEEMAGNVYEWCLDVWHDNYQNAPEDGSAWLQGGDEDRRVRRGGAYWNSVEDIRCAFRNWGLRRVNGDGNDGFRVVLVGSGLRSVSLS